jgi:hypothetical protein
MILFTLSCSSSIDDLSNAEREKLVAFGDTIAQSFQKKLFGHLTTALGEGGAPHAITACNIDALDITKAAQIEFPKSLDIKRISFKYRNPKNAPDKYEIEALNYLADPNLKKGDTSPTNAVQKINLYAGMAEMCLQCHGTENHISKIVSEKLTELYPNDLAVDYDKGDFRGAIRIQISKEDLMK